MSYMMPWKDISDPKVDGSKMVIFPTSQLRLGIETCSGCKMVSKLTQVGATHTSS